MKILDGNNIEKIITKEAVLIDVFRATSSIIVMLFKGANEIIPFENEELAREFIKTHNNHILVGEHDGIKIQDFDFGNSPSELLNADFSGKHIIFVSTNGTRILKKIDAEKVYIASFLNADKVIENIGDDIPLICANRRDLHSIEDFLCASYIKARKFGFSIDYNKIKEIILRSKSANRLRDLNAEKDIEISLMLNRFPILAVYEKGRIIKL